MGNSNGGSTCGSDFQGRLDNTFRLGIEGRRGLVEK
jgi:hypothetical protein